MTPAVTDIVQRVVDSPFNDRLTRAIDFIVIALMLLLLIEWEFTHLSKREAKWKGATRTWFYVIPIMVGVAFIFGQRLKNLR